MLVTTVSSGEQESEGTPYELVSAWAASTDATGYVTAYGTQPASAQTGNTRISGEARSGSIECDGAAAVGGTLGVTGAATLSNTLGVTGAATLSSTLAVTGASTLTGGATIGSGGNAITKVFASAEFVNPGSVAAGASLEIGAAVSGAAVGDFVIMAPAADYAASWDGLVFQPPWVSASGTVKFKLYNPTSSAIDPGSMTIDFLLIRV